MLLAYRCALAAPHVRATAIEATEFPKLADGVSLRVEEEPASFERFPAISVRPEGEEAGVRYEGLPWGYELSSLVGAIREAGRRESSLRPDSLAALAELDRDLRVDVFVTPT